MLKFPVPPHELSRQVAVTRYHLLDTSAEVGFDELARLAAFIAGTPIALISLIDSDRQWFKARHGFSQPELARERSICAHAICEPQRVMVVNDLSQDGRFADNPLVQGGLRFYAGAPLLTADGLAVGTICVFDHSPRQLSPEQQTALQAVARSVVTLMELGLRTRELESSAKLLERLSLTDTLTLVGNRYAFEQRMKEETERSQRYSHPLSLLMIDIDHFAAYNEQYGHIEGDVVLKLLAQKIGEAVRGSDCVYRYGAEEFAVMLPETDINGAMIIGGRVRELLNGAPWPKQAVTCSIGIGSMEGMMDTAGLVGRAERALHWVKEHGRNAVQHSELLGEDY